MAFWHNPPTFGFYMFHFFIFLFLVSLIISSTGLKYNLLHIPLITRKAELCFPMKKFTV